MLFINLLPLILFIFAPTSISSLVTFFMIFLGTSVVALANSWFFVNKIFPYYMPAEKEEEELSDLEESSRVIEAMDRASTDFLQNSGTASEETSDSDGSVSDSGASETDETTV